MATRKLAPLDRFGQFVMANLRDKGIEHFDLVAQGHWKAERLRQLQADLKQLSESQRAIVRRCIINTIDAALHDFLFALQELDDIQVLVQGKNIAKMSDGLHGEIFSDRGWMARFSKYGESPESA